MGWQNVDVVIKSVFKEAAHGTSGLSPGMMQALTYRLTRTHLSGLRGPLCGHLGEVDGQEGTLNWISSY